ncbi:MAG: alpha/beta hydrolase [Alphaproteobacteria bacterium]|nr:alpha/beta hydrolase [Alphaproteobacteria bacterium]
MSNNSQNKIIRSSIDIGGHRLVIDHPEDLPARPGPVWMFIHGIAVTSAFWAPLMPADFRDRAAWMSVSLPVHAPSSGPEGFAQSDVTPDLFNMLNGAVLDQLLPGRNVVIVGHSTGGFAGLCLALARPDRVLGVVSVGGFADGRWTGLEGDMLLMARKEKLGSFGPTALRIMSWLTTRWPWLHAKAASMFAYDKRAFLIDKPTKVALRAMRRDARLQNQDQLIAFFAGIRDVDIWDQVGQIKQPVLVLDGEHDPVIPHDKTLRLAEALPNGQLLLYPNVGHMVMNERREDFWRDVIAWRTANFSETPS